MKIGSKIGETRKITSCFRVSTTIGETEYKDPDKCGQVCVRTQLKKITLRKWKHACYCDEAGWWMVWAPTGVLKDYEIATGYWMIPPILKIVLSLSCDEYECEADKCLAVQIK